MVTVTFATAESTTGAPPLTRSAMPAALGSCTDTCGQRLGLVEFTLPQADRALCAGLESRLYVGAYLCVHLGASSVAMRN
eukprot:1672518-Rhodomonas_salina.1